MFIPVGTTQNERWAWYSLGLDCQERPSEAMLRQSEFLRIFESGETQVVGDETFFGLGWYF